MKESILKRIKKLLAMSKDVSSPEEAMTAARLVRKYMDKYQVEELDLSSLEVSDFGEAIYDSGMKSRLKTISIMCVALAKFNDCQAVYSGSNILFRGLKEDSDCAVEMAKFLVKVMYSTCKRIGLTGKDGTAYRLGFTTGICEQVKTILVDRADTKMSDGKSLIICKNQLVAQHFGTVKYANTRQKVTGSNDAYSWGKAAGRSVNLNNQRGIE